MKLFLQYLKQRRRIFIVGIVFCVIFSVSFLLYHLPIGAVIYPTLLCAALGILIMVFDFLRVKREHEALNSIRSMTDVIAGSLPKIDGIKDEDYQQILRLLSEEHNHYRTQTNRKYADMIDYYTVWAHQIKTPIASMRLHLQNEDSALSRTLTSDLHRIEQYVEMVLTFLRLNSESTDYVIKEYDLDKIIKSAVRKFSTDFIGRKLSLVYEPVNTTVITDEKWLSFVIEQVLSNALKYTPAGSITITLENEKTLRIRDTGIGIAPEDLPRIFENGYTGYNGRTDKKASGIGLYLCKRICNNLGHTITARSIVDVGTIIEIDLAQTELEVE
ncbi:MAG: HAMP domain-containing histidine kinase [Ruminococcaceae bacterium]|nr:HAMP domain-containing histidine kinase [Oscillospiraceae bacterium]